MITEIALRSLTERKPEWAVPIERYVNEHAPIVAQQKSTTGPPTHAAEEGTLLWNTVDNELYINSSGGTAWSKADFSGHNHTHDQLSNVTADQHHAQSHGHNGDGSGAVDHASLGSVTADQHHTENHASRHRPGSADTETLFVRKTTAQFVDNTTTLQNDDELQLTLSANATYIYQAQIYAVVGATGDLKIGMYANAPTAHVWKFNSEWDTSGSFRPTDHYQDGSSATFGDNGGDVGLTITGIVRVGGSSKTLLVRFAQATASILDSTAIYQESFLVAWRVA